MRRISIYKTGILLSLLIISELGVAQGGIWLPKKWKENRMLNEQFKVGVDKLSESVMNGKFSNEPFVNYFEEYFGLLRSKGYGTKRTYRRLNKSYTILREEFNLVKRKVDISYWKPNQSLSDLLDTSSIQLRLLKLDDVRNKLLYQMGGLKLEAYNGEALLVKNSLNTSALINFTVLSSLLSEFGELEGLVSLKFAELNSYKTEIKDVLDSHNREIESLIRSWTATDQLIKEYLALINVTRERLDLYVIR